MKRVVCVGASLLSLILGACAENQPVRSERVAPPAVSSVRAPGEQGNTAIPAPHKVEGPVASTTAPPPGAQWTIYCASFRGPDHVLVSNRVKEDLLAQSHLNGWHLIHHDDESILYYGYYAELRTPRARADKRAVEGLTSANGDREFAASMFVPLSAPNPSAPPEWDLSNTPADMYWSLQIAAFCQTPDHWERAVQAVRDARAQGIEAYYYHTDSMSTVCVGAWPKLAVRQQNAGGVAHNNNPDVPVVVASHALPDGAVPNIRDANGNPVPVIAPKLVVDDPTLQKAIDQFPENAVNGYVMTQKDKNGKDIPASSFLVEIPHRDPSLKDHGVDIEPQGPAQSVPTDGTDTTLGKLRTIGEH